MEKSCSEESLTMLISTTAQVMRSFADQWLKKYELTVEQLHVIKQLDTKTGLTQNQLCRQTGKNPANLTRLLDRLATKKYIVRKSNPKDRRASLVLLTKEGVRIRDEVLETFDDMRSELLQGIGREKLELTFDVLKTIKDRIEKASQK